MFFDFIEQTLYLYLGYQKHDRQSFKARCFLKWYAHVNNIEIQTCESLDGEYPLYIPQTKQTFKLDGFIKKEKNQLQKDVAIEFLGCCWHGKLKIILFCTFYS